MVKSEVSLRLRQDSNLCASFGVVQSNVYCFKQGTSPVKDLLQVGCLQRSYCLRQDMCVYVGNGMDIVVLCCQRSQTDHVCVGVL